jgi:pimeloyl-ACP methyl ester carboxylesterase
VKAVAACAGVTETILLTKDGLVGVLSSPEGTAATKLPAIVILNSGVIHRVGSCRFSVELARRLALTGHSVFRFDHSGIGDSPPSQRDLDMEAGQVADVASALDAVQERTGSQRFIVYGLCSGARGAFNAALEDPRIVGIVQVDGFAFRTSRYYLVRAIQRLRSPSSFLRMLGRWTGLWKPPTRSEPTEDMWVQQWPEYPPRGTVESGYRHLVERGVRIHAIYTGSWDDVYNHRRQFLDMYPGVDFAGLLTLWYLPAATHILPDPDHQEMVMQEVTRWVAEESSASRTRHNCSTPPSSRPRTPP